MRDAIFVAVILGFFVIAAAYVSACARIIGRDEPVMPVDHQAESDEG